MLEIKEHCMSDRADSTLRVALWIAQVCHSSGIPPRLPRTQRRYRQYLDKTTPEQRWTLIESQLRTAHPNKLLIPEGPYDLITRMLGIMGASAQHLVYWFDGGESRDLGSIASCVDSTRYVVWINEPMRQSITNHPHGHVIVVR